MTHGIHTTNYKKKHLFNNVNVIALSNNFKIIRTLNLNFKFSYSSQNLIARTLNTAWEVHPLYHPII